MSQYQNSPYHEHLLHWIWATRHLNFSQLQTKSGQPVHIYDPGIHNKSDGPDFLQATLQIGSLKWYGDIEIHWSEKDWNRHGHHRDPRYNQVILHIVYHRHDASSSPVLRQDGSPIETLFLQPCLEHPLQEFLVRYNQPDRLPCSEHIPHLSPEVFRQQIQKAHKAYFEHKVDAMMKFYDSSLPPPRAWKKLLVIGLFDGLGIAHNREPMRRLGSILFEHSLSSTSAENLTKQALAVSGVLENDPPKFTWNHKGCRPSNHPRTRITQAAQTLWFIQNTTISSSLLNHPEVFWDDLNAQITTRPGLGDERSSILFGTVWLPALYIWGQLFGASQIKELASETWSEHRAKLPRSILQPFHSLPVPAKYFQNKLGAVYQLRTYCKAGQCERCNVFKNVISS